MEKPGDEADDAEPNYEYNNEWNVDKFRQAFCHTGQEVTIF